ncbi:class I SAM-dependent methyltransferase [Paenibacillus daejeonensis]|uniref:class I SAM-dependent methyltransferase n=1 Tax=Paenibacillus daejeonensis TaxID=135193 RepID=UPI00035FF398|nr:class I SAM-dependent methyltransferase [Paenibacillus daejeonensis]
MKDFDYQTFYDAIGRTNGWDFSQIKCVTEGEAWEMYREVAGQCTPASLLLDIGTGGGEAVLSIADSVRLLVGVDRSAAMIETAQRNAVRAGHAHARFLHMEADHLAFPDAFFDVVSSRHSEWHAGEIARVLASGGTFITQQVSEGDKSNLKEAFGRGQAWGVPPGELQARYVAELRAAGFRDIRTFEFSITEYYETAEDLIFLLKHTPIIPNFGREPDDSRVLHQFIETYRTDRGIRTNADRFGIIARR